MTGVREAIVGWTSMTGVREAIVGQQSMTGASPVTTILTTASRRGLPRQSVYSSDRACPCHALLPLSCSAAPVMSYIHPLHSLRWIIPYILSCSFKVLSIMNDAIKIAMLPKLCCTL